jgi:hypothetical protein
MYKDKNMIKLTIYRMSFFTLLLLIAQPVQAGFACFRRENRCREDFECSVNPLECGSFGVQLQGGVYPIIWKKRSDSFIVNCTGFTNPVTIITDLGAFPKYNNLYKVSWVIGGQLSYALSCNTNVFVEFNYAQSSDSKCTFCNSLNNPFTLVLSKYKLYNGYVGVRYYFDRWCDRVSLFIGPKVGFVHHKKANFDSLTASTSVTDYTTRNFFGSNTVVSGGGQIGLDICGWCGFNFVITGEVVASCGPRAVGTIALSTADAAVLTGQILLPGHVQTELAFPVTLGVKYNF